MPEIKGIVSRITYHNDSNGYSIFRIVDEKKKEITCVGVIEPIEEGDYFVVSGEFVVHPTYGEQLKANLIQREIPTDINIFAEYLAKAINGIGPALAKRIVKAFGEDTFNIIEKTPEKLADVSGISSKKAKSINEQFLENNMSREEQMFFLQLGISSAYAVKIKKKYGPDTKEILYTNPYQLIEDINGIGFVKADSIAAKAHIPKESIFRIKQGIVYLMEMNATAKGHTLYPTTQIVTEAADLLDVDCELIRKGIEFLAEDKKIMIENEFAYLPMYYYMELNCAAKLKELLNSDKSYGKKEDIIERIKLIEKQNNVELDETQRLAVYNAITKGVIIITGGPGTGKTTTLNIFIKYLERYVTHSISLAAPTGRAAKRMTEQTKREAMTIHRMVGLQTELKDESEIIDDNDNTSTGCVIDSDVVIIDEMSMVDISLFYILLKSIKKGTKVVLVGDVDQLPSVGPGKVLKDLIESKEIPVSQLRKIHRQAEKSNIVVNAHMIIKGKKIELTLDNEDFIFVERVSDEKIIEDIKILISRNIPNHFKIKPMDVQILVPMKKGKLGTINLNLVMQDFLNPKSDKKKEIIHNNVLYREGDKVMHLKNDYKLEWVQKGIRGVGVFNGEVGFIKEIKKDDGIVLIEYEDERIAEYEKEDLNEITLAYAITIHKSQGSEYPAIIIPLLSGGPPMLYNRNLLYTGVTRAKDCVIILGKKKNVYSMISNTKIQKRYTNLSEKIRQNS